MRRRGDGDERDVGKFAKSRTVCSGVRTFAFPVDIGSGLGIAFVQRSTYPSRFFSYTAHARHSTQSVPPIVPVPPGARSRLEALAARYTNEPAPLSSPRFHISRQTSAKRTAACPAPTIFAPQGSQTYDQGSSFGNEGDPESSHPAKPSVACHRAAPGRNRQLRRISLGINSHENPEHQAIQRPR